MMMYPLGPEKLTGSGQAVAYTGTAGTSARIDADTIDVTVTTAAFMRIGAAPTAVANDYYLVAGQPYRFPIEFGSKVSFVQVASGGTAYIHPVSYR